MWPDSLLSRISFRRQIILLGVTAAVLLMAVVCATFVALRFTKSAMLRDGRRHLTESTDSLVREYNDRSEFDRLNHLPQPLKAASSSDETLAALSGSVLRSLSGVEGGFYSSARNEIVGYSFPTGPAASEAKTSGELPADVRLAVMETAQHAIWMHSDSNRTITAGQDIVLIEAMPLSDGQNYVGSAWTMMRLTSLPGANRLRTYLVAVGLGIAALGCVLLTLLVVRGLQNGVRRIEDGLKSLELNLASEIPAEQDPDEIRQIARAINRLGSTLREKIESEKEIQDRLRHSERLAGLGRLIAGVAHEVRNPLATIRLRLQMCQQDSTNEEVLESCAVALQEVERLNGMVNRLLSFSRPVHLEREAANLGTILEQRLGNFAELAKQSRVRFAINIHRNLKPVEVDHSRIAQVFDNVIQNAIEAMAASGGTLYVSMTASAKGGEPGVISIEFKDTGSGISQEVISRIFDPFFTTKTTGTGLGLSICHELVQAHGGEIQVTSEPGMGTTLRVVIPASSARNTLQVA